MEGTETGLGVGPSREDPGTMGPGGAGGDEGARGGLVSAAEAGKEASGVPFAVPPSVRKWKLWETEEGVSGQESTGPTARSAVSSLGQLERHVTPSQWGLVILAWILA